MKMVWNKLIETSFYYFCKNSHVFSSEKLKAKILIKVNLKGSSMVMTVNPIAKLMPCLLKTLLNSWALGINIKCKIYSIFSLCNKELKLLYRISIIYMKIKAEQS